MATQLITKRTVAGVAAVGLLMAGVGIATATSASAVTTNGKLIITSTTGTDGTVSTFSTTAPCSAANDSLIVSVSGSNVNPSTVVNATGKTALNSAITQNANGGWNMPATNTWATWASLSGIPLSGTYTVTARCFTGGDTFVSPITFSGSGASITYTTPIDTVTTLALATPSPITFGTPDALTATVAPTTLEANTPGWSFPSGQPSGSITFNGTGLGTAPTATLSGGTAAFAAGTLGASATPYSLTATYTPDAAATTAGVAPTNPTSSAVSLTVNQASTSTTVTLSQGGSPVTTVTAGSTVLFTGTVSPAGVAGTVAFSYTTGTPAVTTPVGGNIAVNSSGVATYSWVVPSGASGGYTIGAVFTPGNGNSSGSTATPAALTVSGVLNLPNTENLQVTLPAGTITATINPNNTVLLGTPTLHATGTTAAYFQALGTMNPLVINDSRAGDTGWNVTAGATDFTGTILPANLKTGTYDTISAHNLGIVPSVSLAYTPNAGITTTTVNPAAAILPGASSTLGLTNTTQIVSAALGSGLGQNSVNGALTLNIPTRTAPDTFNSTLTLTVLPQ